tara:strand:- start:69 stop:395 length:327 start_codon:yes stop_codon:yes gene_type:complete
LTKNKTNDLLVGLKKTIKTNCFLKLFLPCLRSHFIIKAAEMKTNKTTSLLFPLVMSNITNAQTKDDVDAIKSMCGCYKVTFDFVETFSAGTSYKFHENHHASALEAFL